MPPIDREADYGPADLVVSTTLDRAGDRLQGRAELLPARELVYRVVRERGPLTLADLTRELSGLLAGAPAPYEEAQEAYVLRLVAGGRVRVPALASFAETARALADQGPDPDYGLVVEPAAGR